LLRKAKSGEYQAYEQAEYRFHALKIDKKLKVQRGMPKTFGEWRMPNAEWYLAISLLPADDRLVRRNVSISR